MGRRWRGGGRGDKGWAAEEGAVGAHGGSFGPGQVTWFEERLSVYKEVAYKTALPTDHGATNGFSANANMMPETPMVLVWLSTRVSGILTHPLAPPFL